MQFINIGFGNIVQADRILAIISPDAAPTKRMIQEAKQKMLVIDRHNRKKNTFSNNNGHRAYSTLSCTTRNVNQ